MSNAVYPEFKEFLLSAAPNVSLNVDTATDGPFCSLIDTAAYTYSAADSFYSSISPAVVGTDQRITAPTVANGVFDGNDVVFPNVTGNSVEALVIYRKNSGGASTWKVVIYMDTSVSGLPVQPNGGNINITWAAPGIFGI